MVDVNPNVNVPNHYITQYSEQVHIAYQRGGFTLRSLVRTHGQVSGDTIKFPKIGKGEAVEVERGSKIPPSNSDRTWAEAKLKRTYAREDIADFDKLVTNYDLIAPIQTNNGMALGRKHDDKLLTVMNADAGKTVNWDISKPLDVIDEITAYFVDEADIDLNGMPLLMPQANFNQLMRIEQFANAEWVGGDNLPWKGVQGKVWNNMHIMTRTKLQKTSSDEYIGFAWDKNAVGAYGGGGVTTKVSYDDETDAHRVISRMDQGTCVIDPVGVVKIIYKTS